MNSAALLIDLDARITRLEGLVAEAQVLVNDLNAQIERGPIDAADRFAYSAEKAAELLGVHASTVRRMMARGDIAFVTLGVGPRGKRRLARSTLERLVGTRGPQSVLSTPRNGEEH